jgi:hypothetical protein
VICYGEARWFRTSDKGLLKVHAHMRTSQPHPGASEQKNIMTIAEKHVYINEMRRVDNDDDGISMLHVRVPHSISYVVAKGEEIK